MIPNIPLLIQEITDVTYPTRTYKIVFAKDIQKSHRLTTVGDSALAVASTKGLSGFTIDEDGIVNITYNTAQAGYELSEDSNGIVGLTMTVSTSEFDRISGYTDDLDAVIQAIYLILSTERYKFIIYSWDYGVELVDLYGKPMPYVMAELPRRITEALTQDDRITDVKDFEFEKNGKVLHTTFTVVTEIANIDTVLEVSI